MTPHEAVSWAETFDHGRLGDAIATAAIAAIEAAGYTIIDNDSSIEFKTRYSESEKS